jgi:hypothetical protein
VQVFVESGEDSDFAAPASKPGRSRAAASAGSDEEEEEDVISDASEEEDAGRGRRQALPARQLPGRNSRPVSYKDASSSGSEDDEKADDFGGTLPALDACISNMPDDMCKRYHCCGCPGFCMHAHIEGVHGSCMKIGVKTPMLCMLCSLACEGRGSREGLQHRSSCKGPQPSHSCAQAAEHW